jgi:tryptophanyl-tRNA synthetase
LFGYLEGSRKVILPEPQALLDRVAEAAGTWMAGRCRSRTTTASFLREEPAAITAKIRPMSRPIRRGAPQRSRRPEKCPVWPLHQVYSDKPRRNGSSRAARRAGIGCLECKQPLIDAIIASSSRSRSARRNILDDPVLVRNIVADGCDAARKVTAENDARRPRGDGPRL